MQKIDKITANCIKLGFQEIILMNMLKDDKLKPDEYCSITMHQLKIMDNAIREHNAVQEAEENRNPVEGASKADENKKA